MFRRKLILCIAVASVLMILNLAPAFAQQQEFKASFTGFALGESAIIPNWFPGDTEPENFIIGRGSIAIHGSAIANGPNTPNENVPYNFYFAQSGVKSRGNVAAQWKGHMIDAFLYSNGEPGGIFVNESQTGAVFMVGIFPGSEMLSFKAIYKDHKGYRVISGKAGVFAMPLGDTGVMGIAVAFLKRDGTPLLTIIWAQEDLPLPSGAATLHEAKLFTSRVKIAPLL